MAEPGNGLSQRELTLEMRGDIKEIKAMLEHKADRSEVNALAQKIRDIDMVGSHGLRDLKEEVVNLRQKMLHPLDVRELARQEVEKADDTGWNFKSRLGMWIFVGCAVVGLLLNFYLSARPK